MDDYDDFLNLYKSSGCLDNATYNEEVCSAIMRDALNDTILRKSLPITFKILKGFSISFYSLSILLNITLLLLLYKDPLKRFRNSSSFLILNLVVADLSGASISLLHKVYDPKDELAVNILLWFVAATLQCSFCTMMFVSFDRYVAIAFPFRYRVWENPKRTILINIAVWILSLSLSSLLIFIPSVSSQFAPTKAYAANIFILFGIIVVFYTITHRSFRRQQKHLFSMKSINQQLRQQKLRIEKNLANTMLLVSFSLQFFTSPYLVLFLFQEANCLSCIMNAYFQSFWSYWPSLFALYYATNPIIYAWKLQSYRKSLKQLLNNTICRQVLAARNQNSAGPPSPRAA